LIVVLLNLAFIPDDVIKGIKSFENGWSFNFCEAMKKYYLDPRFENYRKIKEETDKEVE